MCNIIIYTVVCNLQIYLIIIEYIFSASNNFKFLYIVRKSKMNLFLKFQSILKIFERSTYNYSYKILLFEILKFVKFFAFLLPEIFNFQSKILKL